MTASTIKLLNFIVSCRRTDEWETLWTAITAHASTLSTQNGTQATDASEVRGSTPWVPGNGNPIALSFEVHINETGARDIRDMTWFCGAI